MKKTKRIARLFLLGALCLGFVSCSDDEKKSDVDNNGVMKSIVDTYIDDVVFPTYKSLANNAQTLYDACQTLYAKAQAGTLTQKEIDAACEAFKTARRDWEQSEAFLYGAAADNEIDPHIDSWPLDHKQLQEALNNKELIAGVKGADAVHYVYTQNKHFDSVVGFHGLEFVLFRDGKNRTLEAIKAGKETAEGLTSVNTMDELAFAAAVSGDLRNMIFLLEYGWLGTKVEAAHSDVLKAAPWLTENMRHKGLSPKDVSYGDYVRSAKLATGMFSTWQEPLKNIFVGGCSNICQEVATQKLGQAYRVATGTASDDDAGDYIESPYSKRSFIDYQDNILSIKNSLYGARNAKEPVAKSLLSYLKAKNYADFNTLTRALDEAVDALEKAKNSGKAFIDAPGDPQVKTCIEKVQALDDALNKAGTWVATLTEE